MRFQTTAGAAGVFLALSAAPQARTDDPKPATADARVIAPDGATIYRVFLTDGTSLVSYGEPARVGDRVIFSMPTAATLDNPPLHLINLAAHRVDWPRTERYSEAARAARYFATSAEEDYVRLTSQVAAALADVATASDPTTRLAIVEKARRTLADWPRTHYNYRQAEIAPMLGMIDEIVAELRALSGAGSFDLTFVARADAPPALESLVALPTPREAIEQVLVASDASDASAERLSLLSAALGAIERNADRLPSEWRTTTRAAIRASITAELETDRQYQVITARILDLASRRAKAADVRGIQRLLADLEAQDRALGSMRPDTVTSLVAWLEAQLEAARKLRLARDRWALRLADFQVYSAKVATPLARLTRLHGHLEDIKSLAGSSPFALAAIQKGAAESSKALASIAPPDEFRSVHALFLSAAQLADTAAKIRMEATLTGDLRRAWDASSAAAGAVMLEMQGRNELKNLSQEPQLIQPSPQPPAPSPQ
jgi:hypothetical protein